MRDKFTKRQLTSSIATRFVAIMPQDFEDATHELGAAILAAGGAAK